MPGRRFRVQVREVAYYDLTALWAAADPADRTAIVQALRQLKDLLAEDPLMGLAAAPPHLCLDHGPVRAFYEVDLIKRNVTIDRVEPAPKGLP